MPLTLIPARPSQSRTLSDCLAPGQRQHLRGALADLVPRWSVELQHDAHGETTIVILPEDLDDAVFPTLIVHTEASAFHLEELRGDSYRKLGEYRAWGDVLRAVRIRLLWETPLQTTLH